jgi:hypothetical protein
VGAFRAEKPYPFAADHSPAKLSKISLTQFNTLSV